MVLYFPRRLDDPYAGGFTDLEEAAGQGGYVSRMTDPYKQLRYAILHMGQPGFEFTNEHFASLAPEVLALAVPEWYGGQAPGKEEYPDDYVPPGMIYRQPNRLGRMGLN